MNCFECTVTSARVIPTAVGCCASCGVALCLEHAHLITLQPPTPSEWTRTISGARRIACPNCYAFPAERGERAGLAGPQPARPAQAA